MTKSSFVWCFFIILSHAYFNHPTLFATFLFILSFFRVSLARLSFTKLYFTKFQPLFFLPRLHVQSPTCSNRSSSISVSCTRHCWWSSSSSPLIPPPPPLPRLVCILPVALSPVNQSWIPSQVPIRLRASPTHCTPKSRRLRPMPTTPMLSVRLVNVSVVS